MQAAPAAARYQVGSLMTREGGSLWRSWGRREVPKQREAEQSVQWSRVWSNSAPP